MRIFLAAAEGDPNLQTAIDAVAPQHGLSTRHYPFDFFWYDVTVNPHGDTPEVVLTAYATPAAETAHQQLLQTLNACDAAILVAPGDAEAHLILGMFLASRRRTGIWIPGTTIVPSLLHKSIPCVSTSLARVLSWLEQGDPKAVEQLRAMNAEDALFAEGR